MKYLYFRSRGIAIPLQALEACADLRFVESEYDDEGKKTVFREAVMKDYYRNEAVVIDDSEILPPKEEESETP